MQKNIFSVLKIFMVAIFILSSCQALPRFNDQRPNFLIIVTDDQRYDTMQYMPNTQELIFNQGVTFDEGYVTTPFCCPSRSSILTGMYAHNHWVHENGTPLKFKTVVEDVHNNGYFTGLVGKYLNSWKGETRYEFDFWVSIWGGTLNDYYDPDLDVNGTWSKHTGYATYIFRDYVLQFLDEANNQSKPFLLIYAPNAPHAPHTPAKEDLNLYTDLEPFRPESFNEADTSDKPLSISGKPLLTDEDIEANDNLRRRQILTLVALDRTIPDIINKLKETGELDNTVIIFLSDNGKHWGEHRFTSKSTAYEEVVKVPFALRYPDLVPVPYIDDSHLVANIDIAPTIYELSETKMPETIDGLSLVGLLNGTTAWRDHLLLEAWPDRGHWAAIHTGNMIYIETQNDLSEFYDLSIDPFQMDNMINDEKYQDIIAQLKLYLEAETIPTTTQP